MRGGAQSHTKPNAMAKTNDKKTVVIFAGAGASTAVSPDKYPTTIEFFKRLPETVTTSSIFGELRAFITNRKGKNAKIDIEDVLWHLQDLNRFLRHVGNQDNVVGWFAAGHRLGKAIGLKNSNFGQFEQLANQGHRYVNGLIDLINRQVYEFFGREPNQNELAQTWMPLLKPLYAAGYRVELATTNYDVVLEHALDAIIDPDKLPSITGRTRSIYPSLDTSLWTVSKSLRNEYGLLTKLHGSVDWRRGSDRIYTGTPLPSDQKDSHIIIYPGFKGQPDLPEFQAFHAHFGRSLATGSAAVFVGFAFRDDYINEICRTQLSDRAKVVVLNPDGAVALPFDEDRVSRIAESFGPDSIENVSSVIHEALAD